MTETLSAWRLIKEDVKRYTGSPAFSFWKTFKMCYYEEALFYSILFRICQGVLKIKNPVVRFPLKLIFVWILYRGCSVTLGIYIDLEAAIARGLYIGHYGCIFIGPVEGRLASGLVAMGRMSEVEDIFAAIEAEAQNLRK